MQIYSRLVTRQVTTGTQFENQTIRSVSQEFPCVLMGPEGSLHVHKSRPTIPM
jgi:hypothetical protein